MNKPIKQEIVSQIFSILLFGGLIYFWVEDRNLGKSIHTTVVYIIFIIIIDVIRFLKRKKQH